MSRRRKTKGSVMVELALIFVLFTMLLIGIADAAQFLFFQQSIVERVRVAARWGSLTDPSNITAIKNMVLYLQSATPDDGRSPSFGLTDAMVSVSTSDPDTCSYRLVVQVSGYSFQVLSPLLAGSYTGPPIAVTVPLGLSN